MSQANLRQAVALRIAYALRVSRSRRDSLLNRLAAEVAA